MYVLSLLLLVFVVQSGRQWHLFLAVLALGQARTTLGKQLGEHLNAQTFHVQSGRLLGHLLLDLRRMVDLQANWLGHRETSRDLDESSAGEINEARNVDSVDVSVAV
jgi:hypothetical protein